MYISKPLPDCGRTNKVTSHEFKLSTQQIKCFMA